MQSQVSFCIPYHAFSYGLWNTKTLLPPESYRALLNDKPQSAFLRPVFDSSRGGQGRKRGARTRLLPASAKSVRKVGGRGKTAGPVAGRGSVYLNNVKDSLLAAGCTRETNGPANIPFSLKTFCSGTVQRE